MSNCKLFGENFTISDSYIRDYVMRTKSMEACKAAELEFKMWYKSCPGIDAVMNGYENKTFSLLTDFAVAPLFKQLADLEIYDVSDDMYINQVIDMTKIDNAYDYIAGEIEDIIEDKNEKKQYRANRKASRNRVRGIGFGIGGYMKASMQAGALNATSGLAHGAVNTIGNIGSSVGASVKKAALYNNDTKETLCTAISLTISKIYQNHMDLVNEHITGFYKAGFNPGKAQALFENAKNIPDKREELLLKAVQESPEEDILSYIFINYPEEQKNAYDIAQLVEINLDHYIEESFAKSYTDEVKNDQSKAEELKHEIAETMQEYGIETSTTFDQIEKDCLARICGDIGSADEAQCNLLKQQVSEYDALDKNKQEYFEAIERRIESIWSAEDGEIFDNVYMNTDIYNQSQIQESIDFIKEKGRTSDAQKYIDALTACNPDNIKKAKAYKKGITKAFYIAGILLFFAGIVCFFVARPFALIAIPGIVFVAGYMEKEKQWKLLTINGTQIHGAISDVNDKRSSGAIFTIDIIAIALLIVCIGAAAFLFMRKSNAQSSIPVEATTEADDQYELEDTEEVLEDTEEVYEDTEETLADPSINEGFVGTFVTKMVAGSRFIVAYDNLEDFTEIETIPEGSKIKVYEGEEVDGKKYYAVDYFGIQGYVENSDLEFLSDEDLTFSVDNDMYDNVVYVNYESGIFLHSEPLDSDDTRISDERMPYGSEFTISEIENGWGKTEYDGEECWINLSWCGYYQNTSKIRVDLQLGKDVTTVGLWEEPDKDSDNANKLADMPNDSELEPIEYQNGWAKVSYDGYDGWVMLLNVVACE